MINDTVPREPTGQIINKMKLTHAVCVEVASFGSYESIRRDVSYNSPPGSYFRLSNGCHCLLSDATEAQTFLW